MEKYGRAGQATDDSKITRMRPACWVTKATHTHTHTIGNIYYFSTTKSVAGNQLSVTSYVYCLSCFFLGTFDFFGLNHYTTNLATAGTVGESPSKTRDSGVKSRQDPSWPSSASAWLKVCQELQTLTSNAQKMSTDVELTNLAQGKVC